MFKASIGRMIVAAEEPKLPRTPQQVTWRPLSRRSTAELRAQAAEYRRMAQTARTMPVMTGLSRLAKRFDAMADLREREEARGA